MRISEIGSYPIKLRHDVPYLGPMPEPSEPDEDAYQVRPPWRSLYSSRFETLLVRVTAEDGTSGWGEALAPVGPEVAAAIVERLLAPTLVGTDLDGPRPAWSRLRALMRERGHLVGHQADAMAAVDIALWDLTGRLTGRTVADLLGGAFRRHIPVYISGLPYATDDERAAAAAQWAARGVERVKLHLGHGVTADLSTVDAIRSAAPGVTVAVDAHWAYGLSDAIRLGRALEARDVLFLEAPLAPEDIAGHARLARQVGVPIAVGEALRNRYEFDSWLAARALGIAQPDVARTGITEAAVIGELAMARHTPVAPHHSVGLGVALAAGLHVCAAVEEVPFFEFQPTTFEVAQRILSTPLPGGPNGFDLPSGPGLGIEVDRDVVEAAARDWTVVNADGRVAMRTNLPKES